MFDYWTAVRLSSHLGRDCVVVPVRPLDRSDPGGDGAADGLRMILLEIVQASAEVDDLAIVQGCGETLGKRRRYKGARVSGEEELGIARGRERRMRGFKRCVHIGRFARDR